MEKGYVYIARIIDQGGKFVNGYHKIGLSKKYKVRETQLNSTHLPFDVLMVRVFETEDMKKIEGLLHVCFEDYRVIKEYDDRRNITTEWFDVTDIDSFNERIDKIINYLSITELDLGLSVDNDISLTNEEKSDVKEKIGRAKSTNLKVKIGDKIFINNIAKETYINVMNEILKYSDTDDMIQSFPSLFKNSKDEFADSLGEYNKVLMENGLYMSTWGSNRSKIKRIMNVSEHLNIKNVSCEIIQ